MADLGAIEEDVVFDWGKATTLSDELRSTANVLAFQGWERERLRSAARAVWHGRYGDEFDGRVGTCLDDAERLAGSLRAAADGVDELARLAREEQDRREAAREWVASQSDDGGGGLFGGVPVVGAIEDQVRDGVDAVHDLLTGDEVPPDLQPSDPPTIPLEEPTPASREAAPAGPAGEGDGGGGAGGGGGGGVSSADPGDLDTWVTASVALDDTVSTRRGTLDDAHGEFVASCGWGSFDASSVVAAVGTWVTYNGTDAAWVATVAEAFRTADSGAAAGGTITVPDAVIGARLDAAGLGGDRASLTYDEPIVWGEPPTSGYANDPVNTAAGNFVETEVDVVLGGLRRVLRFSRTYNSRSDRVGPFGPGWASWASCRLRSEPGGARWVGPDGQEAVIPRMPSPPPAAGAPDRSESHPGGAAEPRREPADDGGGRTGDRGDAGRAGRAGGVGGVGGVGDEGDEGDGGADVGGGGAESAGGAGGWGAPSTYARVPGVPGLVGERADGGLVITGFCGGRFAFDRDGRPVWAEDGPGTRVTFTHDAGGRLVEMRHAGGTSLHVDWVGAGGGGDRIGGIRCSDGREVSYRYDDDRRLVEVDGGPRGRRRYEVDDRARVVAVVDADGVVEARNSYDGEGRVVAQVSPFGRRSRFRYLAGRVTMVDDDTAGPVNSYVHDAHGRLVGAIDGHGQELRKFYDRWGNPTVVVERDGSTTHLAWDERSRLVHRRLPDGSSARLSYDDQDRVVEVTVSPALHPPGWSTPQAAADAGSPTSAVARPAAAAGGDAAAEAGAAVAAGAEATTRYRYDGEERTPAEIVDPEGGVTRLDVDGGLVRRIVDPDGVEVRFGYDAHGDLTSVTDAARNTALVERDAAGRVVATVTPSGLRTTFAYDGSGRPIERRDPSGGTWHFAWTAAGRLRAVTDPTGARREQRFGPSGQVEEVVDPLGHVTSRQFDVLGNLVSVVLPGGAKWECSYDRLCRLVGVTDPAGATWLREYDVAGRLVGTTDPVGRHPRATYDAAGRVTGVDDGLTLVAFELDGLGRAVAHRRPDGTVARATYDRCGRIVTATDAGGGVTRWTSTPAGRPATVTSPLGHLTRYVHDRRGHLVAVVDAGGSRWALHYDADARLTRVVAPTGETTRFRYDDAGRMAARVSPSGGVTRYEHDAVGRVVAVTGPTGGVTRYRWDPRGHLAEAVDPNGGVVRCERDERGLLRAVVDPLGGRVEHRYDGAGRLVERRDQLDRSTHWEHDPAGRLVRQVLPTGDEQRWWYDGSGRVRAIGATRPASTGAAPRPGTGDVEPRSGGGHGPVVEIERDSLGRPVVVTEPGFRHELRWDPLGRLTGRARNGLGLTWRYDADGRRVAVGYPDGTEITFDHDATGRLTVADHPALGTVQVERDAAGRPVARAAGHATLGWTYTGGHLTAYGVTPHPSADGPSQPPTGGSPGDRPGREAVSDGAQRSDPGLVSGRSGAAQPGANAGAEGPGRRTTAVGRERDADDAGQRRAAVEGDVGDAGPRRTAGEGDVEDVGRRRFAVERDAGGRVVEVTRGDGRTTTYRYDPAGQLVAVDGPDGTWTFRYDAAGRLVSEVGPEGEVTYAYDAAHQLVERRSGEVVVRYRYDEAGRRIAETSSDGTARTYIWDRLGRLARIDHDPPTHPAAALAPDPAAPGSDPAALAPDPVARRLAALDPAASDPGVGRAPIPSEPGAGDPGGAADAGASASGGRTTSLTVDGLGDISDVDGMALLWDPVEAISQLRWLDGTALVGDHRPWAAVARGGTTRWLDPDWQGSVTAPFPPGPSGGAGWDPWGRALGDAGAAGPGFGSELGLGYRGELTIDGLLWLRHRVYDPATRSFLSPDPLPGMPGQPVATHPYHYAGNDPVGAADPLGLRPMTEADLDAYREAVASSGLLDRAGAVTADAWHATTDWVVDNWEYIAVGGVLVAATVIGGPVGTAMVGGMLLSGGLSAGAQYVLTGQVQWDQVALDAAIGGAAGGVGAWAGGATATWSTTGRVGARVAASTATDVGGGMLSRWGAGQNPFDAQGMAVDTLTGTATGGMGEGLDALRGTIRPKTIEIGHIENPGTLGRTDPYGNITIRPGLAPDVFEETLRHERVHAALRPTQGTILADTRANVVAALYKHSDLFAYTEEAMAEGYATRSLRQGLRFPLEADYGISPRRMAMEGAGVMGVGAGGGYGVHELLTED